MKLIYGLLLIVTIAGCNGTNGESGSSNLIPSNGSELYVFGDEISYGEGVTTSYVDTVGAYLNKTVVNWARAESEGGAVITMNNSLGNGYLTAIGSNLDSSDVVIIFAGHQDSRYFGNVSASHVNEYLGNYLDQLETIGCKVYVIGTIKMLASSYALFNPLDKSNDTYMLNTNNNIESLVNSYANPNIVFIDAYNNYTPSAGNTQADGQYPNETGHQELADIIINQL